jgi:serine O-acetyltransferase
VERKKEDTCKIEVQDLGSIKARLPDIAEDIIESCSDQECYTHIDYEPIPSKEGVIDILNRLREILFPGYFSRGKVDPVNLKYTVGQSTASLFDKLSEQIYRSIRHDCLRYDQPCSECDEQGYQLALKFLETIPALRKALAADVRATYHGDPAAQSYDEVIFSYPGIFAITVYRIAHQLIKLGVPLLPRIMTEYAHSITGIDIHPAAKIGKSFVIDHGTGVVIGETTEIGDNVRIYQGVTLGALSIPKDASDQFRGQKRHPTIEDDVIIYSGATILGGETVIGARSVIGGNVWLTESVPADTTVIIETPRLIYKSKKQKELRQALKTTP